MLIATGKTEIEANYFKLMRCSNCGICCTETEMLLSQKDILRLEKKGYKKKFFLYYDKEGYAKLKNNEGYCVFYNSRSKRCNIYSYRPEGCRVYPVIVHEDKGIILDSICESRNTITKKETERKGKKVLSLLERIDNEALYAFSQK